MSTEEGRDAIESKIMEIDRQIFVLNNLKNQYLARLQSLSTAATHQQISTVNKLSPDEKVALFKDYFRGRDDIYAKLWINSKTGKRGYSPACGHEWDRALWRVV